MELMMRSLSEPAERQKINSEQLINNNGYAVGGLHKHVDVQVRVE